MAIKKEESGGEQEGVVEKEAPEDHSLDDNKMASNATSDRNRKRFLIPLVLILGLAGAAYWYFVWRQPTAATNIVAVSGRIESDDSAISVKISGRIREISVREGDRIKAGQLIAVLDDAQLNAQVEQAKAVVQESEAAKSRAVQQIGILKEQIAQAGIGTEQSKLDSQGRVTQAEAQIAQVQSQIAQAEAQLAQAEANLKQSRYDEERFARLFKTGDIPESQLKHAQTNREALSKVVVAQRKQVEVTRSALKAARGSFTVSRATAANTKIRSSQTSALQKQSLQAQSDIDAANARISQATAQLRQAEENRSDLNVTAPFDGVVATRAAEPGEVVSTGATIITLIPNQIYLRAFVPEGDIGRVKIGQPVRIYLDSSPDQPVEGVVTRIDPEAAFTPENTYFQNDRVKQVVGVKLEIKNPKGNAKPGMPAEGEILVDGNWNSSSRAK